LFSFAALAFFFSSRIRRLTSERTLLYRALNSAQGLQTPTPRGLTLDVDVQVIPYGIR
jgi:hypothetical protein